MVEALAVRAVVDLAVLAHRAVLVLAQVVARRVQLPRLALLLLLLARAHLPVPERRPVVVGQAHLVVSARLVVLVPLVLAAVPVLADLVVEPAVPVQLLLSRQSFSATRARSSP